MAVDAGQALTASLQCQMGTLRDVQLQCKSSEESRPGRGTQGSPSDFWQGHSPTQASPWELHADQFEFHLHTAV